MLKFVKNYLKKKKEPIVKEHFYMNGGGWGDAINVDLNAKRATGWKQRRPLEGDILIGLNKEGTRFYVCKMVNIEYVADPPDMFFADLKQVPLGD